MSIEVKTKIGEYSLTSFPLNLDLKLSLQHKDSLI